MKRLIVMFGILTGIVAAAPSPDGKARSLRLNLRTRIETAPGSGVWRTRQERKEVAPAETAIVICDMWNQHW